MKFIDLFAGIGGFHEGMTRAGHECVGFCEYDRYAVASYTSMYLITEEQREYLATLPLKQRQQEILKEEYRNGMWYRQDIRTIEPGDVPRADIWCFGAPCQDFSIAGPRIGLEGNRSSLVGQVFRLINEISEEMRPRWLVYENVKGMLSSNRGLDYLAILSEMDRLGYDCEWQNINSKWFVPQNRERIYTVGHLRAYGRSKIFPLQGADGKDSVHGIKQVGMLKSERSNPNLRVNSVLVGIAPTLSKMDGGGREPHIFEEVFQQREPLKVGTMDANRHSQMDIYHQNGLISTLDTMHEPKKVALELLGGIDYNKGGEERQIANSVIARYDAGVTNHKQEGTAVLYASSIESGRSEGIAPTDTTNKGEEKKIEICAKINSSQDGVVVSGGGISPTHTAGHGNTPKVMLYAWTKQSLEQNEGLQTPSQQEKTEESPPIIKKEQP